MQIILEGATAILPLGQIVDLARERARLEKVIEKVSGEMNKVERKLANAEFIAKARPEIVEEQRQRLGEAQAQRAKLAAALDRLV